MSDNEVARLFALEVVKRLQQARHCALWAGGCVRDIILGETPADYDVATDATPEQVMAVLPFRAITVGISFGVVRVRHPHRIGLEVEVATFRSDGAYIDGRHPESVVFGSAEVDAARRDFTINGMFFDPVTDTRVDFVGGQEDLKHRILRAIGDPQARFREDKLRVLRAIRLSARLGFQIEPRTLAAIKLMAAEIVTVSYERIAQELKKMLVHDTRSRAMELLLDTGLVAAILPDLLALKGMFHGSPIQPEGDLWDHVLLVLELLPADPSFNLAFAALLHEAGKPLTRRFHQGRNTFHRHEQVAAEISDRLSRQLKLSNAERERIQWLVGFHESLAKAKTLKVSTLKRMLARPGIDELLALHRADALATTGNTEHVDYCEYYLKVEPAGPINPAPLITGDDLVRHGLKPGVQFAKILEEVRDAQLEGQIRTKRAALKWVDRQRGM